MKNKILKTIRMILTFPTFLGFLFPLLCRLFGLSRGLFLDKREMVLKSYWTPKIAKKWKYSTTLSRGMVFQPNVSIRTRKHEDVHVRQAEDKVLLSLFVSLIVSLITMNFWWMFMWPTGVFWQAPNFLGAVLRGGNIYRDAEHERSAYAQTDTFHVLDQKTSWIDYRLRD